MHANTDRGLLYGAASLLHLSEGGYVKNLCFYNSPICQERGIKLFIPSKRNVPFFKKFVNMLVFYKFNTIMIEVGGAMEYKRHPEINKEWVAYCREMSEYSGKTTVIQDKTFPWYKNAIHMENGDGGYLSQDELRGLIQYCKERGFEVIPEVPSLGHCDYLMMGNPDIAERADDPYPDTYCPSNPKSYQILFDVIDEIIDVFEPSIMNIGHDEYYTIGVCEKCRGKSGADLFSADVNKIADYLAAKNVRTMIWGDKLLKNAIVPGSGPFGGAQIKMYTPAFHIQDGKFIGIMPATYQAIDKIYKDIEILHWNWGLAENLEDELFEADLHIRYGNFESYLFPNWRRHMSKGSRGAIISNWSTLNETILQRNGIFFNIAYSYVMFWDPDYREENFETIRDAVMKSLYNIKNPELQECRVCQDSPHPSFIEITYNTDYHPAYQWFVDGVFPEDSVYEIGEVRFLYADGMTADFPVKYGENIGFRYASWERVMDDSQAMYKMDNHLIETTYSTCPVQDGKQTYYRHLFKNPYPEKELTQILVEPKEEKGCRIFVRQIDRMINRP